MAVSVFEIFATKIALEVLWVHALTKQEDVFADYGFLTFGANVDGRIDDQLEVLLALAAVSFTTGLLELGADQIDAASLAREMVGMVHSAQCPNDALANGLLAGVAALGEQLHIVRFAVGLAL